jgi:hypothetical protein
LLATFEPVADVVGDKYNGDEADAKADAHDDVPTEACACWCFHIGG